MSRLRHAYNVPLKELNMLVIKAILDLSYNSVNYFEHLQQSLSHLLPLIRNYIKSRESQVICLTSLEEYCLQHSNKLTPAHLSRVIHYLYDNDILEEEVIIGWHQTVRPLGEFDLSEQEQLRSHQPIQAFVKWLLTAEEESSSEESD